MAVFSLYEASLADQEDDQIMNRVRDGEIESFAELFERRYRQLYRFFYNLGGWARQAENLNVAGSKILKVAWEASGIALRASAI